MNVNVTACARVSVLQFVRLARHDHRYTVTPDTRPMAMASTWAARQGIDSARWPGQPANSDEQLLVTTSNQEHRVARRNALTRANFGVLCAALGFVGWRLVLDQQPRFQLADVGILLLHSCLTVLCLGNLHDPCICSPTLYVSFPWGQVPLVCSSSLYKVFCGTSIPAVTGMTTCCTKSV